MTETGTVLNANQKQHLANGYTNNNNNNNNNNNSLAPQISNTLWSAGGGMTSSLPDMMKYIKFQLDGENELALKSHEALYENEGQKVGYYWPIEFDDKNGTYLFHHGGAFGIQNLLFIIPKRNLGVLIVTNQSLPETAGKLFKAMDGILNDVE